MRNAPSSAPVLYVRVAPEPTCNNITDGMKKKKPQQQSTDLDMWTRRAVQHPRIFTKRLQNVAQLRHSQIIR